MRVLITGAQGQVGYELLRLAPSDYEVIGLGSTELDISDTIQVDLKVNQLQPQLIINAAAYTAVDKAESDQDRAWAVNHHGVANLAIAAKRLKVPLFHISTDYVFSGDACEPYRECDPTGPTGVYGASKLAGEQALAANCSHYVILRTSWVFAAKGNNFVKTMLRLGNERDDLGVVGDQHGGPTSAASIASTLWGLAKQYNDRRVLHWGTYHYSGAPACTWYDFAQEIFRQAQEQGLITTPPNVRSIDSVEYPTPAKRPAWSVLDCSNLRAQHTIDQPDWRLDLTDVLIELHKQKEA